MLKLRLVLAWLLMAALPLQGMAAASMLFCGSQAQARLTQGASQQGHHGAMDIGAAHDHASHGHGTAHGSHGHSPAAAGADQAGSQAPPGDEGSSQSHSCPICASCSQAQAVGGFDRLPITSAAPAVAPSQPPVRVPTRTLTLPDKPPRA